MLDRVQVSGKNIHGQQKPKCEKLKADENNRGHKQTHTLYYTTKRNRYIEHSKREESEGERYIGTIDILLLLLMPLCCVQSFDGGYFSISSC